MGAGDPALAGEVGDRVAHAGEPGQPRGQLDPLRQAGPAGHDADPQRRVPDGEVMGREVGRFTLHGGVQFVEQYPNGYGVSIVSHDGSYGGKSNLFEVAVLHGTTLDLCYATPVTNDVLGWQDWADVANVVDQVKALPMTHDCPHTAPPGDWEEIEVTLEVHQWQSIIDALTDHDTSRDQCDATDALIGVLVSKNVKR